MKKFDVKLDILRVLSMLLVIVIHVANYYARAFANISHASFLGATIFDTLARVSVPIFFMISGALLLSKEYDSKKNIKRIKRIVVTLLAFTVIYFLWDKFFMNNKMPNIISLLFSPERNMLWFLYAIVCLYIALPFIKILVDNMDEHLDKLFVILWFCFNGLVYLLKWFVSFDVPYLIPFVSGTYYLGYFVLGYLILKYKDKINLKKYSDYILIASLICASIIIFLTYTYSVKNGFYVSKFFQYRSLLMNVLSIGTFILIYFNIPDKEIKIIKKISPYSFGIYLVHGIILNILMEKIVDYQNTISFIGIPLCSIIILLVSFGIVYLLKKIPIVKDYL